MTPTKTPLKGKQKRTYVLSAEIVERLEAEVPPGKRGAFVDKAIEVWIDEREREQLRAEILQGLIESREHNAEVERDWAPLSDELWSKLPAETWPEPAIIWPQGLAAAREQHRGK